LKALEADTFPKVPVVNFSVFFLSIMKSGFIVLVMISMGAAMLPAAEKMSRNILAEMAQRAEDRV